MIYYQNRVLKVESSNKNSQYKNTFTAGKDDLATLFSMLTKQKKDMHNANFSSVNMNINNKSINTYN